MNIKVAAFTVSEKSSNITLVLRQNTEFNYFGYILIKKNDICQTALIQFWTASASINRKKKTKKTIAFE